MELLLGMESSQRGVYVLFLFQGVPLSDRAAWVGQHVGPVLQLCARGLAANKDLSDGVILTNLVVVEDGDHHKDFLGSKTKTTLKVIQECSVLWSVYNKARCEMFALSTCHRKGYKCLFMHKMYNTIKVGFMALKLCNRKTFALLSGAHEFKST